MDKTYPMPQTVLQTYNAVVSLGRIHGKNVIIGETGWPTCGARIGTSIPSPDNQKIFLQKFLNIITISEYYLFEAFDEKWKETYGLVEGHWGLYDSKGMAKHDLSALSGITSKNNWR